MKMGSVTAAARALYISQPSVSRLLSELEYSAGIRFFHHKKGKFNPTRETAFGISSGTICKSGPNELILANLRSAEIWSNDQFNTQPTFLGVVITLWGCEMTA